jgi:hypothetical protein
VVVNYGVCGGTATSGADFTLAGDTLVFNDGDTGDKTIALSSLPDTAAEGPETIQLWLANPIGGATLGTAAAAEITIQDDDTAVELASAAVAVGESAGAVGIPVIRRGDIRNPVTVRIGSMDGTAESGFDYLPVACMLEFAAGETNKIATIAVLEDPWGEPDETLQLVLSSPSGGALLGAIRAMTITVTDNDRPGSIDSSFEAVQGLVEGTYYGLTSPLALALQSDGSILLGGSFFEVSGPASAGLARLYPDGSLDPRVAPQLYGPSFNGLPVVRALAIQPPNGQILIGGDFWVSGCMTCYGLARFHSDGALDLAFNPPALGGICDIKAAADGSQLLVGGSFW